VSSSSRRRHNHYLPLTSAMRRDRNGVNGVFKRGSVTIAKGSTLPRLRIFIRQPNPTQSQCRRPPEVLPMSPVYSVTHVPGRSQKLGRV
jgi:hypothetical protein